MPNPGKFHGKRKVFLTEKRTTFNAAVDTNRVSDVLFQIYRAYFKRFPLDLSDDAEPTDEALLLIDDDSPDPEADTTALEALSGEAYDAALELLKGSCATLEAKKGQIKRWFYYRYMRDNAHDPRSTDPSNPYNALIMRLSGISAEKRPRCKTPLNIWCKEPASVDLIEAAYNKVVHTINHRKRVAKRAEIAGSLFKELDEEKQQEYAILAKEEHELALKKHAEGLRGEISTTPADRQRCISALPQFVQPWLDALARATGFQFALTAGGPEPIRDGRLNVISMYGGTTAGTIPLNFGQAERDAYVEAILPRFGKYLKSCYTPEECRRRALQSSNAENSLQSVALDEGALFHTFGLHTRDPISSPLPTTHAAPPIPTPTATEEVRETTSTTASTQAATAQPITSSPVSITSHPNTADSSSALNTTGDSSPVATEALLDSVTQELVAAIESPCQSLVPTPAGSTAVSRAVSPSSPKHISHDVAQLPSHPPTSSYKSTALKRTTEDDQSSPAAKRTRTDNAVDGIILPPDAPAWIKDATNMLQRGLYPGRWHELIAAWLVYEGRSNFEDVGRLSPKGRPKVVAEWIKWARKPTYEPKPLPNITLIQREHTAWWRSLQPQSRIEGTSQLAAATASMEWPQLRVCGMNGIVSVLASLYFWGMSSTHANVDMTMWEAAVEDCLCVIRHLPGPL